MARLVCKGYVLSCCAVLLSAAVLSSTGGFASALQLKGETRSLLASRGSALRGELEVGGKCRKGGKEYRQKNKHEFKKCRQGSRCQGRSPCQCDAGHGCEKKCNDHPKCTSCKQGFYSPAMDNVCAECQAGSVSSAGMSQCTPCSPGSVPSSSRSSCIACPSGTSSPGGLDSCETCQPGSYAAAEGSTCLTCPQGCTSGTKHGTCWSSSAAVVTKISLRMRCNQAGYLCLSKYVFSDGTSTEVNHGADGQCDGTLGFSSELSFNEANPPKHVEYSKWSNQKILSGKGAYVTLMDGSRETFPIKETCDNGASGGHFGVYTENGGPITAVFVGSDNDPSSWHASRPPPSFTGASVCS